jgi:thiol:disulfide interchange protein
MKNKIIYPAVILVVLSIGLVAYLLLSQKPTPATNQTTTNSTSSSSQSQASTSQSVSTPAKPTQTQYLPYSEENIKQAKDKNIVLFFNASWCPTCQATTKNINNNITNSLSNTTILSVDYDTYPNLKAQYSVTMQHTFVKIDPSLNLIKKQSGLATLDDIVAFSK